MTKTRIEITPDMVDAGAEAIRRCFELNPARDVRTAAMAAYMAMVTVANGGTVRPADKEMVN